MANILKNMYTPFAGRIPAAVQMLVGQIALNFPDGIVYAKEPGGSVQPLTGKHKFSRFGLSANYSSASANTRIPWDTTLKNELGLTLDTSAELKGRLVIPSGPTMRLKIQVYAHWNERTTSRNLSHNISTTATGTASAAPHGVRLIKNFGSNAEMDGVALSGWHDYPAGYAIDIGINSSTSFLTTNSWVEIERAI